MTILISLILSSLLLAVAAIGVMAVRRMVDSDGYGSRPPSAPDADWSSIDLPSHPYGSLR